MVLVAVVLGAVVLWCLSSAGNKYMVLASLAVLDRGLENFEAFFSLISQSFKTGTDTEPVKNLVIVSFPSLTEINFIVVRRSHEHDANPLL